MKWILLLLLVAPSLEAATRFAFASEVTGNAIARPETGTVVIDGDSYRIDHVPPKPELSSLISTDGGKTVTALNAGLRTYYHLNETKQAIGLLAMIPLLQGRPQSVTLDEVSVTEEPAAETIAGFKTRKYVLRLKYRTKTDVGSEVFPTSFTATGEIWTTDAIDSTLDPFQLRRMRTGYDDVDTKLREVLAAVKGFPLMRRLAVSRKIANGRAQTELYTTTFSDFASAEVPAQTFSVPAGYEYQEPVIVAPGR
ncbi:MAG TPA: hypothetical protein VHK90_14355 [Thermoanaerobaculia bacterium]|nr:hypothetical protein [Thermoanaerobaculia bacterium]